MHAHLYVLVKKFPEVKRVAELKGVLVLSDGSIYCGQGFGAETIAVGELVFHTAMTGYQESLTDPSYAGQILLPTYPLIGNYGVNAEDFESKKIHVAGYAVREQCIHPVHRKNAKTIDAFLKEFSIPGVSGLDTRSIVRKIRSQGVMPACVACYSDELNIAELIERAKKFDYSSFDFVEKVSTQKNEAFKKSGKHVVLIDCGVKANITRELNSRNISVTAVNYKAKAEEILALEPDGLLISNGPGDPAVMAETASTVRKLFSKLPIMGICLGHQIIAHAGGGKTFKMKFGHRSANQPVKDLQTNKVFITTQNHGFAVDEKTLPKELKVSQINCNDGTVEGLQHKELPIFSAQYHPEAHPGPRDTSFLFDEFVKSL